MNRDITYRDRCIMGRIRTSIMNRDIMDSNIADRDIMGIDITGRDIMEKDI